MAQYRVGGLFSPGVDPIRLQAALAPARVQFQPRAPGAIGAPSTVLREPSPLAGLGEGLAALGAKIGDCRAAKRRAEEIREIMAPVKPESVFDATGA